MAKVGPDWIIVLIILLSSSAAFRLGFLAGRDTGQKGELEIVERPLVEGAVLGAETGEAEADTLPALPAGGQYVASKTGKSYHHPWCSGAKLIKDANKVWFSSKEEAEAKGYTPAGNCPGI